ncbi:flavodoxin [Deltaproteobacteria bacterium]|nr:flavodoxin [Deltaproteobacteria bacterium]
MKALLMVAFALMFPITAFLSPGGVNSCSAAEGQGENKKILVAYFSHTGNTRELAEQIHARVGGDIAEIKTVKPYPADHNACMEQAKQEQEKNARPALATEVRNLDSYEVIFIGYPNWWGTIPMPLFTFFEKYNFAGKTIIPFCTHGGSRLGRSVQDIKRLCPNATVRDGLDVRSGGVNAARNDIAAWLGKLGLAKS